MAAVTKGSGKYFYDNDRVWREAMQSGIAPFTVGNFGGRIPVPAQPTKDFIRDLCEGTKFLGRVQRNRLGCFDVTFTFSKSVSIVLFGLTPHANWARSSTKLLVDATRPEVMRLVNGQRANAGAQGTRKAASEGAGFAFCHWESSRKTPQGHVHYAIPNITSPAKGKPQSIANAREMFLEQGVMRARANKRLDDLLQDRGFVTRREGNAVGIAGVPQKLVERLSPSRRAMNRAMKRKKFSGPRAQDFYARQARRQAGPRTLSDPEAFNKECRKLAAKHGLTSLRSLKRPAGSPAPHRDPYQAASVAYDVASSARDRLSKKHGTFTAEQFLERVFLEGIGKATSVEALDTYANAALKNPKLLGIKKQIQPDGSIRYEGPQTQAAQEKATGQFKSDTRAAWEDLKRAARGLGEAAFISTTKKATDVLERLARIVNPPPRTVVVDARDLASFTVRLKPTHYVKAHAKAIFAGLLSTGNPHERAYVAEQVFARLRSHDRLERNTVVVVRNGLSASARDLEVLAKIAKRDGASVILSERSRGGHSRPHGSEHEQQCQAHGRNRRPGI